MAGQSLINKEQGKLSVNRNILLRLRVIFHCRFANYWELNSARHHQRPTTQSNDQPLTFAFFRHITPTACYLNNAPPGEFQQNQA